MKNDFQKLQNCLEIEDNKNSSSKEQIDHSALIQKVKSKF